MKLPFKFVKLRRQREGSANATIYITCCITQERLTWNKAVEAGWMADSNGIPFCSYYSPEGKIEAEKRREQEKQN